MPISDEHLITVLLLLLWCVVQAICQLPQLTLLTSLTPPLEALQLNPARPHPGCDLARLAHKSSLAGMDVAVLAPEHLASIGQFTALQQLNLRCEGAARLCLPERPCGLLHLYRRMPVSSYSLMTLELRVFVNSLSYMFLHMVYTL